MIYSMLASNSKYYKTVALSLFCVWTFSKEKELLSIAEFLCHCYDPGGISEL